MNKEPFSNIAGYEEEKSILKEIIGWYKNKKIVNNKSLSLPKGILFYGPCGTGKTAFATSVAEALSVPCFTVRSQKDKSSQDLEDTMKETKELPLSVVFIDELDLLLDHDYLAVRTLRNIMDETNNVIFVATTNAISGIDDALLREGRFEKKIEIDYPTKEDAKEIYAYYLEQLGCDSSFMYEEWEDRRLFTAFMGGATIKSIVNDAAIRTDFKITKEDLIASYDRVFMDDYFFPKMEDRRFETAIHEAGHVACIMEAEEYYAFDKAYFDGKIGRGKTRFFPKSEKTAFLQAAEFKSIVIGLGGYYAEKLILSKIGGTNLLSDGVSSDLETIRFKAARLVNCLGYCSPVDTLPYRDERKESWILKLHNEIRWKRIIRKACRAAKHAVKKHRKDIEEIAAVMMEKGVFNREDYKRLRLQQK